ncbi:uncharacterized protein LOC107426214 isoform X2 [Ziziphus jujuba]|uniref:Uncharacterized protein LOC107426214 isoform X2 n=1 Tax=Ziziphus jujuba TaxID=326968 RepID=A0A6P6GFM9_ZIZJJ|nr:uncharacterized protein LOC107426214 isoform X2 [Ziziphus jujuba]
MALEVCWYDFVCFGIVGISFFGALWVIWRNEGSFRFQDSTMYESLVVAQPDSEVSVTVSGLCKGHVSTCQLWTSCWRGVHPKWLLATRFLSFLVLSGFLAWDVFTWGSTIFIYYTEWTFAVVIVYFVLGTIVSAYGCWLSANKPPYENVERTESSRRDLEESGNAATNTYREKEINGSIKLRSYHAQEDIQQKAGFWGYLMQVAFQTCAGAVILTDVVFWCVIVPFLSNAHLRLNVPFPWFRLAYFVLWSCTYVIFQWVIHACGFSWWPYPFLELGTPWAPLWYFCLALVHIPCYGIYALIIKAKYTILPRLFPHDFV